MKIIADLHAQMCIRDRCSIRTTFSLFNSWCDYVLPSSKWNGGNASANELTVLAFLCVHYSSVDC